MAGNETTGNRLTSKKAERYTNAKCNCSEPLMIRKTDSSYLKVRSWFFDHQGGSE
jgi:hypothetical protein